MLCGRTVDLKQIYAEFIVLGARLGLRTSLGTGMFPLTQSHKGRL